MNEFEFRVGDKAERRSSGSGKMELAEVLAIFGDFAWVQWESETRPLTVSLAGLTPPGPKRGQAWYSRKPLQGGEVTVMSYDRVSSWVIFQPFGAPEFYALPLRQFLEGYKPQ